MSFSDDIKKFIAKYEVLSTNVYRNSCRKVSMDIAEESPVSTGHLLGSWAPAINGASSFNFKGGKSAWSGSKKDKGIEGANRMSAMASLEPRINFTTESLTKKDTYYFTNDVDYVRNAEYEGWLNTGPYRMREMAILNWKLIVNDAVMNG